MARRCKVLGLTVVAAMAISAVVAQAASAANLTINSGGYPATVSGTQTNENVLSNGVRSVTCATASLTGTLSAASESITITPSYAECTSNGSTEVTVVTNGCKYSLKVTGYTEATRTSTAQIGITGCENAEKQIEIKTWEPGVSHESTPLCTVAIKESKNSAITGFTGTNKETAGSTAEYIQLKVASSNIVMNRIQGTAANCGVAEKTTGTYNGEIKWTAAEKGLMVG